MRIREYGDKGPVALLLHGGPGASRYLGPVARVLAKDFRVLEPEQRGGGSEPLRVADHVEDLRKLVAGLGLDRPPSLVGHSWGAMLALAFAAEHPDMAGPMALVGCGCFDEKSRTEMRRAVARRTGPAVQRRLQGLAEEIEDPDERLCAMGELLFEAYSFDIDPELIEPARCDAKAHEETWRDVSRLIRRGIYPQAFTAVSSPVFMLHGDVDPHPGGMIRDSLAPFVARLEYKEFERCGHYPWLERQAAREFHWRLGSWLAGKARREAG